MPLNKDDCKLLEIHSSKTNKFSLNGYKTYAKCVYVYDGDTIHVVFKMPNSSECFKWVIRMMGIDTPEMKTKNTVEKAKAVQSRDFLKGKILDKVVILDCLEFDKYGRLLGNIFLEGEEQSLSQQMIANGHAKAYDGGTKEGWGELDNTE
jgi:endonuclease YncB( thermonuclease family)